MHYICFLVTFKNCWHKSFKKLVSQPGGKAFRKTAGATREAQLVSVGGKRRYTAAHACGSVQEASLVAGCTGWRVSGEGEARTVGTEE